MSEFVQRAFVLYGREATTDGSVPAFDIEGVTLTQEEAEMWVRGRNSQLDRSHDHLDPDGVAYYSAVPRFNVTFVSDDEIGAASRITS